MSGVGVITAARMKAPRMTNFLPPFQRLSLYQSCQGEGSHDEGHVENDAEGKNHENHKFQAAFHGKEGRKAVSAESHEEMETPGHNKEIGKSNASQKKAYRKRKKRL